jgi:hypothetical protein
MLNLLLAALTKGIRAEAAFYVAVDASQLQTHLSGLRAKNA